MSLRRCPLMLGLQTNSDTKDSYAALFLISIILPLNDLFLYTSLATRWYPLACILLLK